MPTNNTPRILCLAAIASFAAMLGCHHDHDRDPHEQVVVYDQDHHFEHHGYYDDRHDWHGGYYDDRHEYHADPHDFDDHRH